MPNFPLTDFPTVRLYRLGHRLGSGGSFPTVSIVACPDCFGDALALLMDDDTLRGSVRSAKTTDTACGCAR
jgi:hypothetical protein